MDKIIKKQTKSPKELNELFEDYRIIIHPDQQTPKTIPPDPSTTARNAKICTSTTEIMNISRISNPQYICIKIKTYTGPGISNIIQETQLQRMHPR